MVSAERMARRQRIRRLIADLRAELEELEASTIDQVGARRALTENFFWRTLAPILLEQSEAGLTTAELHEELARRGRRFESGRFRVFLNRMKQKHWLEVQVEPRGRGGKWRLTNVGRDTARSR